MVLQFSLTFPNQSNTRSKLIFWEIALPIIYCSLMNNVLSVFFAMNWFVNTFFQSGSALRTSVCRTWCRRCWSRSAAGSRPGSRRSSAAWSWPSPFCSLRSPDICTKFFWGNFTSTTVANVFNTFSWRHSTRYWKHVAKPNMNHTLHICTI